MSNNQSNKSSNKPSIKQENQQLQQEKLQAILLLDSYSNKFEPFSLSRAECLLPLVGGKTFLDSNIEFLIENDIEEIYLFCTRHHKQIKEYIDQRKFGPSVEIHFLYNFQCLSLGDAMREIDAKGLVRNNFILITGSSIVSNIKIKEYLEKHKKISKTDKNAIMTMLLMNKTNEISLNESNLIENTATSIILGSNNRILNYEQFNSEMTKSKSKYLKVPIDILTNAYKSSNSASKQQAIDVTNAKIKSQPMSDKLCSLFATKGLQGDSTEFITHLKTIQQRNDLLETQLYLCSPYVLHIFTDNFDFETMGDFIRGVLVDEEVAGYTIYVDFFKKQFGSHFLLINNLNSYYYQTMRLLQRPDLIFYYNQKNNYNRMLDRLNVFVSKRSNKFGDGLKLERNVLIGSNCKIGDKCKLVNCYISDGCIIGHNVEISNSIIWSNSVIGNNCLINASLIGNNVRIGNNCTIIENSIFSNDCLVKDHTSMIVRGVFFKKDHSTSIQTPVCEDFSVQEENYTKYISTSKFSNQYDGENEEIEGDQNDEFDSTDQINDDEDEDDDQSITSEKIKAGDSSKNNHFYVWKLRSNKNNENKTSVINKLLRQNDNNYGSDIDFDFYSSDYSKDSTEEEEANNLECNDDNNDCDDYYDNKESQKQYLNVNQDDTDIFLNEAIDSLHRGFKQNLDPENIILEINSSKHANNIQIDDLCYYLARAFLYLPIVTFKTINKLPSNDIMIEFDYFELIKTQIEKYDSILKNYYTNSKISQKQFLNSYRDFFIETKFSIKSKNNTISFLDAYYVKLLHHLYNNCDFLNEEQILDWFESQEKANLENKTPSKIFELRKYANRKLEPFIKWLKEPEDDDDDDENEDQ